MMFRGKGLPIFSSVRFKWRPMEGSQNMLLFPWNTSNLPKLQPSLFAVWTRLCPVRCAADPAWGVASLTGVSGWRQCLRGQRPGEVLVRDVRRVRRAWRCRTKCCEWNSCVMTKAHHQPPFKRRSASLVETGRAR